MIKSLIKNNFTRASALAMGTALAGCGSMNTDRGADVSGLPQSPTARMAGIQSPEAVPPSPNNRYADGSVDYSRPSPDYYNRGLGNRPYQGPSRVGVYGQPGIYRQEWGFNTVVEADGSTRSYEGCWDISRETYRDTDGVWKERDRVSKLSTKNEFLCRATNLTAPIVKLLPSPPPYSYRYGGLRNRRY
jgi:hypothetical protein